MMGIKGVKTGGRAKGTPNRSTIELQKKAHELGVDPFEILCLFAKGDWQTLGYKSEVFVTIDGEKSSSYRLTIDPAVRAKCASEIASYLFPKRKAIEHSSDPENPIEVKGVVDKELILDLVKAAKSK